MLLVPQTAADAWRVLCALVCLLFSLSYFPLVLCPTLFTSSGVFFLFPQLVIFKCLRDRLRGGGARQFVLFLLFFFVIYLYLVPGIFLFGLFLLFRFVSFVLFLVFFFCFLSFLYFIECVCRACRIQYLV